MINKNKHAFSFVELIISITIIVLLSVIWYSYNSTVVSNKDNTKVQADLETIKNSLELYSQDEKVLPMPEWNNNFFKIDMDYAHSYEDSETFWVYWSFTENTLAKRYLDIVPLDPRTNSYYAYWKTNENYKVSMSQFELAWVLKKEDSYISKVVWNYTAEHWPFNLIRAYNNYNFVEDGSSFLAYNPEELVLTATDKEWNIYRQGDIIETWTSETKEIYFSDGSVSVLEENSKLVLNELSFPQENNLVSNVKLFLQAWTIWTKATKLDEDSLFEVYSSDWTAAVRWTIFWVTKENTQTQVILYEWKVEVTNNSNSTNKEMLVNKWETPKSTILKNSDIENIINLPWINPPTFEIPEDVRWDETLQTIIDENNWEDTQLVINDDTLEEETNTWIVEEVLTCEANEHLNWDICEANQLTCSIWSISSTRTWDNHTWEYSECIAQETITPWTSKTANLEWTFKIELVVNEIPTTTQYLLYWWDEFKIRFYDSKICFKKGINAEYCKSIWADKKIVIERTSWDDIYLNGANTYRDVSSKINTLHFWYFLLWESHILEMNSSNMINFKISK